MGQSRADDYAAAAAAARRKPIPVARLDGGVLGTGDVRVHKRRAEQAEYLRGKLDDEARAERVANT